MSCGNSGWGKILSAEEIAAYHALTARIDPSFAARDRAFYESRSLVQLNALAAQAWQCNEPSSYQIARSYAALKVAA